ncbi:hypothetical protein [Streptomyces sp. RPT161]|uniref:hypothetical protein n=1 Tax=Streptomyces sp. RPT161 TaxID=3015993 RepID=UPI0022B909E0|nr:hypothetical protein [Streptomyces sp. RPT161]
MPSNNHAVTYEWSAELTISGEPMWATGTSSGPEGYSVDDAYRDACDAMAQLGLGHFPGSFVIRPVQG